MVTSNKKKIWFDFDMDIQIGFSITLFLHGEDELHELVISFMCFNFYIYWWNRGEGVTVEEWMKTMDIPDMPKVKPVRDV